MSSAEPLKLPDLPRADATALDGLYRALRLELVRFVQKRFGSGPPDPEEVAQAAFERLARTGATGDVENARAFLFTVAANVVRDHHRRATFRAGVDRDRLLTGQDPSVFDLTPERILSSKQRLAAFKHALAGMPDLRRRVFLMVRIEGLSTAEVAARFGLSENAVYQHVSRALRGCLAALEALEGDRHD
jgi:RNA polymerase sigma factor (sigma-70 family)